MVVWPVLDLLNGAVVRGIAGRREQYQPVKSHLTNSTDPLTVARALAQRVQHCQLYVADLGGIIDDQPHWHALNQLIDEGFSLSIDAGLRALEKLLEFPQVCPILGLESIISPTDLKKVAQSLSTKRVLFSLDLRNGQLMNRHPKWQGETPLSAARQAIELGFHTLIVLDVADVGVDQGSSTLQLVQKLQQESPHVRLIAGGGVRGLDDLRQWAAVNLHALLVASALHDGRLTSEQLAPFIPQTPQDSPLA